MDYQKLAEKLARLILRMVEGSDMAYGEAEELIEEHFPDLFEEFS